MDSRSSVMVLYSEPDCINSHFVRLVVAEKEISAHVELVDPANKPEDLRLLNPYNSLPTLVDRDLVLYGSKVIAEYLDERYPHPPFMPIDPVSRAWTRLTLYRIENDWYSLLDDLASTAASTRENAVTALRDSLVASADVFAAKPFFLSDDYSVLDATLAPFLWRLEKYGVDLPAAAKPIQDYARRLFLRDGFQGSLTDIERAYGA